MTERPLRLGVVLQGVDPPEEFARNVSLIEELGYDQLWLTDSSLHARYVFAYMTLAAVNSSRFLIGSGVSNPLTRHPAMLAAAIATVDEISGGRAILGIGVGDRPLNALGFKPAPLRQLEASISAIRRLLAGETVSTADNVRLVDAHLSIPARRELPVYVSASGPRTLELAGRVADGVVLLAGMFDAGIDFALEHIRRGAETAGRPMPDIAAFLYGSIRDDSQLAIDEARSIAAWFPQTAPVYCELAGMPRDLVEQVRANYVGGEFQEARRAAGLIPDALVARLALAGTPADAADKVAMLRERGIDCINVFPLGKDRLGTVRAFARAARAESKASRPRGIGCAVD
jgi:5,10-methylenetetrahydromethanopterin reductase